MTGCTHDASMKDETTDRTGVFLVRLWLETDHSTGLRARITQTLDTSVHEESRAVAATAADICAVVTQWVEDFMEPRPEERS